MSSSKAGPPTNNKRGRHNNSSFDSSFQSFSSKSSGRFSSYFNPKNPPKGNYSQRHPAKKRISSEEHNESEPSSANANNNAAGPSNANDALRLQLKALFPFTSNEAIAYCLKKSKGNLEIASGLILEGNFFETKTRLQRAGSSNSNIKPTQSDPSSFNLVVGAIRLEGEDTNFVEKVEEANKIEGTVEDTPLEDTMSLLPQCARPHQEGQQGEEEKENLLAASHLSYNKDYFPTNHKSPMNAEQQLDHEEVETIPDTNLDHEDDEERMQSLPQEDNEVAPTQPVEDEESTLVGEEEKPLDDSTPNVRNGQGKDEEKEDESEEEEQQQPDEAPVDGADPEFEEVVEEEVVQEEVVEEEEMKMDLEVSEKKVEMLQPAILLQAPPAPDFSVDLAAELLRRERALRSTNSPHSRFFGRSPVPSPRAVTPTVLFADDEEQGKGDRCAAKEEEEEEASNLASTLPSHEGSDAGDADSESGSDKEESAVDDDHSSSSSSSSANRLLFSPMKVLASQPTEINLPPVEPRIDVSPCRLQTTADGLSFLSASPYQQAPLSASKKTHLVFSKPARHSPYSVPRPSTIPSSAPVSSSPLRPAPSPPTKLHQTTKVSRSSLTTRKEPLVLDQMFPPASPQPLAPTSHRVQDQSDATCTIL